MKFFFCDVCGVRVSDADLRSGLGMRRRHDVICATCLELGHGRQWAEAKGLSARTAATLSDVPTAPEEPVPPVLAKTEPSLADAASGFGALSGPSPVPAKAPSGDDLMDEVDEVRPISEAIGAPASADPGTPPPSPAAPVAAEGKDESRGDGSRGAGAAKRSGKSTSRSAKAPVSGKSGKAAAVSTRALRAKHQRLKMVLVTLVGLCVIGLAGIAWLVFAPTGSGAGGRAGNPRDIQLKDERDQLFKVVGETRQLAFRDPHDLGDAEVAATIAKIHAMSDAIERFENIAKRGGWSEDNVASQLAAWNVRDITGKLRMWTDENAKRTLAKKK